MLTFSLNRAQSFLGNLGGGAGGPSANSNSNNNNAGAN